MEAWRKPQSSDPDNSIQNCPVVVKVKKALVEVVDKDDFRNIEDLFSLKLLLPKLGFLESKTLPDSHPLTTHQSGDFIWLISNARLETNLAQV